VLQTRVSPQEKLKQVLEPYDGKLSSTEGEEDSNVLALPVFN